MALMILTFRLKLCKWDMPQFCRCQITYTAWQPFLCTAKGLIYFTIFFDGTLSHLHGFYGYQNKFSLPVYTVASCQGKHAA